MLNKNKHKNLFTYSLIRLFNKTIGFIIMLLFFILPVQAFEDCLVITNGRLTDIKIEDNTIVDVHPLITVMNDKNTLIIHPLKLGTTRVCVLKNSKEKVLFKVRVTEDNTIVDEVENFDLFSLDSPPEILDCDLDEPPVIRGGVK